MKSPARDALQPLPVGPFTDLLIGAALAAGLEVGDGERDADGQAASLRLHGGEGLLVAGEQLRRHGLDLRVVHRHELVGSEHRSGVGVDRSREGVLAAEVALGAGNATEHPAHLWLVDGERIGHDVSERRRPCGAVSGEQLRRLWVEPTAGRREPPGRTAMEHGDRRCHAMIVTALDHSPVVVERRRGEVTPAGLDPRPLHGEPVAREADPGQERDVLPVAVVAVTGVTRAFDVERGIEVLQEPQIGIDVVPLDLVRRGGRSPEEPLGKPSIGFFARHGAETGREEGMRPTQ